ncbi:protein CrcB [Thioclava sp. SK-1]|uniref:fluoride efflux transporter CrcB n=1 Tax=Thioclava sp. SK-1 TaxID=1889770 RepID=UPI000824AA7F|nr:fluoride efflux transporter CrcB [Thioclava sp. SK-1]OCX58653.1 protein CrcB [Thioclava sp. SK-1]
MLFTLLQVALGGAIGASGRYLSGVAILRMLGPQTIPLGVIFVNIVGSFLMGALITFLGQKELTHWNPFLATGILGGFTTFSSFSLETWTLIERGDIGHAAIYVAVSVCAALAGLVFGVHMMRWVLA